MYDTIVTNFGIDTLLTISYDESKTISKFSVAQNDQAILSNVGKKYNLEHLSRDIDFIDFNFQRTIPHKFS